MFSARALLLSFAVFLLGYSLLVETLVAEIFYQQTSVRIEVTHCFDRDQSSSLDCNKHAVSLDLELVVECCS